MWLKNFGKAGKHENSKTNSYGALVLNSARVMFIDIDFEQKKKSGGLFGRNKNEPTELDKQLNRIEEWTRQHPQWGLRVYRTFGGLRGLITMSCSIRPRPHRPRC